MLYQLIYTNFAIITLDIALLGIQYADLFYLQGAFKPCVYGIKLKMEFVILNRLVKSVQARGENRIHSSSTFVDVGQASTETGKKSWWSRLVRTSSQRDQNDRVGLETLGGDTVRRQHSQGSESPILERQGAGIERIVEEGDIGLAA